MSSTERERAAVLDDVVELVRRGNVAPPRRVTFPFPQKGRPAGAHADVEAGQSADLVSRTSAAELLGDLVSGVSAIPAPAARKCLSHRENRSHEYIDTASLRVRR